MSERPTSGAKTFFLAGTKPVIGPDGWMDGPGTGAATFPSHIKLGGWHDGCDND